MTLLLIFAAMTAVVLALLLVPLLRTPGAAAAGRESYDLAIYKDQLAEVDRDVERGLLTAAAADAARIEVQRRMLAVADSDSGTGGGTGKGIGRGARWALIAVLAVAVPLVSLGLYATLGRPDLADQPFADRTAENRQMETLVDRLAKRMEAAPNDAKGWVLLGRSNSMIGRHAQAVEAFRQAIAHGGADADTLALYGEALTMANDGKVTDPARAAFRSAYRLAPTSPGPLLYLGVAAAQDGDARRALLILRSLERISPPDAAWLVDLREQVKALADESGPEAAAIAPDAPDKLGLEQ